MIDQAIQSHKEWVRKFKDQLFNERFDVQEFDDLNNHDRCKFGKWLNSERGAGSLNLRVHLDVVVQHLRFHELAADILAMISNKADQSELRNKIIELDNESEILIGLLKNSRKFD